MRRCFSAGWRQWRWLDCSSKMNQGVKVVIGHKDDAQGGQFKTGRRGRGAKTKRCGRGRRRTGKEAEEREEAEEGEEREEEMVGRLGQEVITGWEGHDGGRWVEKVGREWGAAKAKK